MPENLEQNEYQLQDTVPDLRNGSGDEVPVSVWTPDGFNDIEQGEARDSIASQGDAVPDVKLEVKQMDQRQIDNIVKKRLGAERNKLKPDVDLANKVRSYLQGMSESEIEEALVAAAAQRMSASGIDDNVAKELVKTRAQVANTSNRNAYIDEAVEENQEGEPNASRLSQLNDQAQQIYAQTGINPLETIQKNPDIVHAMLHEGMDMFQALWLAERNSGTARDTQSGKGFTPTRHANGGSVNVEFDPDRLTPEQDEAIKRALREGRRVRVQ